MPASWKAGVRPGSPQQRGEGEEKPVPAGQRQGWHPNPQGKTLASAAGAPSPPGSGLEGPQVGSSEPLSTTPGRLAHGPRPPASGGRGRGARLRSPSGVQALADSAFSRPERRTAVTVTK